MTLVLEALRGDEALDAGGFGVGFLAFAFGLDFAADDEFADLVGFAQVVISMELIEHGLASSSAENWGRGGDKSSTRMRIWL